MQSVSLHTASAAPVLTRFDGWPYLLTRVVPAMYHITLLPAGHPRSMYLRLTSLQYQMNALPMCAVLGPTEAWYVGPKGVERVPREAPTGGYVLTDRLAPAIAFDVTPDLMARRVRLARYLAAPRQGGYLRTDLTKGGRPATLDERYDLEGVQKDGVPVGLTRCPDCFEWRGTCLDPNPALGGMVMEVSCWCQNDNLCARCREKLADRKLNGNHYDERDGNIWHWPGFLGLQHQCRERVGGGSGAASTE
ncbi:MAG TPA: hypothetical protein VJ992_06165 [Gemmatimonadales bacterium]|nr:hypothetical protein [Gemmatimonadales bacterium]